MPDPASNELQPYRDKPTVFTGRKREAPLTSGGRRARGRGNGADGLTAGRTVQRTIDKWHFNAILDGQRRPFGREEATLNALKTLRDLDPQASHAVWNYLRMVNPGHDLRTYVFDGEGSETKEEGPAQAYLDDLARRIGGEYGGGLDQLHNVLALGLITTGAVCAEVAPTEGLKDVEDWYPVDPTLITFKRDENDTLILGQRFRDGTFVALNPNQVFYVPLDPDVDDPYGRPPLLPALSATLAKGQMLNDLRAVAHNQGYPRLDVTINWEAVMKAAPEVLKTPDRAAEFKEWTEGVLAQVVTDFEALNVDDTFVHYDWVDIKMVGGAAGVGAFDFASLEKILTRQVNSALKTLPILLGINEATSETHGSIQWQIQAKGVAALQRLVKRVIEKLANASLQIAGLPAHAKVEYEEIRTVDRLFEAQADFFETRTIQLQEMQGWRSHDEASEIITKHAAMGPIIDLKVPNPNLSTNQGGDTSAGGTKDLNEPKPTDNPGTSINKKDAGSWAAWEMVMAESPRVVDDTGWRVNDKWRRAVTKSEQRQALDGDTAARHAKPYESKARDILDGAYEDCVVALREQGYEFNRAANDWTDLTERDIAKDVSDYVFGVGYSRQMKALLREAFEEGMTMAFPTWEEEGFSIDNRLIENVWRTNRPFVLKIRAELKEALRDGDFKSLGDVREWFDSRMWREELMGRFLAKQGLAAGYAYGLSLREGALRFVWETVGIGDSCPTCLSRSGDTFTYDELVSLGFPGSIHLECGANCRCSLVPE